ncbi:MAG: Cu2+-exporting [Geobacteraceae bacterium]|nr:MAG: Cu2+-exporting [Geobacteraceae bacterium]
MTGFVGKCTHCGAWIRPHELVEERRSGETLAFCCRGCHGAYLLITGAGLGDYYRRREWEEQGLCSGAFNEAYSDAYLAGFVRPADGKSAIDILIDGIRCATCVWLNEKIVSRLPGVTEVRVNYATSRALVLFDPGLVTPSAIFERIGELGYVPRPYTRSAAEDAAAREKRDLLIRFGTAFFLTMQLMAYSFALYAGYFQGMAQQIRHYMQLFSLLVTTPVVFYSGWPFLAGGWRGIINRAPNMDLLIAIGALSSFIYSVYATFAGGEAYYETAAMIVTLILAGRLLEQSAKRRASSGVERLLSLAPSEARRVLNGAVEKVAVAELGVGDLVMVAPGERFPIDGSICEGVTSVDESPATGEPMPVAKAAGDPVIAGSINLSGMVRVKVDKPAGDSFVARIARLAEEAQSRKAPIQGVADRVAALFVPAVLFLAAITFVYLHAAGIEAGDALMTALAVVVIACPCALGLATPTAILAGCGAAATGGVIFKGGDVLERLGGITSVVFDKTGTLTCGRPEVAEIRPVPGFGLLVPDLVPKLETLNPKLETTDENLLVFLAASVETGTNHPLARGITECAAGRGIAPAAPESCRTFAGGGVTGLVGGQNVSVGNARFLESQGIALPGCLHCPPAGGTAVYVACGGSYAGALLMEDRLRDSAFPLVGYFQNRGIRSYLLSGDKRETVNRIASALGIRESRGDLLPEEKMDFMEHLRERGECLLMVGDGINDAPALSSADVGCAVAGGTDIAVESSDLVLASPDLARLSFAHRVSVRTISVIRQNLAWAFVYNIVGIPLAMTGRLTPVYAAAAMALSSLCVVGNSLRLLRLKYKVS